MSDSDPMPMPNLLVRRRFLLAGCTMAAAVTGLFAVAGCDPNPDGPSVPSGPSVPGEIETDGNRPKARKTTRTRTKESPGPRDHG